MTVTLSSKLYKGDSWTSFRADCRKDIKTAAFMLSKWSEMYGRPEAISAGPREAKFWFRQSDEFNLLITVAGASLAELRAAWAA